MDNQPTPNRQNTNKKTYRFAYFLTIVGLGIASGILIKLIDPSPTKVEVRLDSNQLNSIGSALASVKEEIKSIGYKVAGASAEISSLNSVFKWEIITVRALQ